MSMPISHLWLAPHSLRIGRREGGTQTGEERSPSWCADEGPVLADDRGWWRESLSRKLLIPSGLLTPRSRGVLCRAWVRRQSAATAEGQPGRERPPLPPPGPGPGPCREGGAPPPPPPAACLVRPDKRDRALVVDRTRCTVAQRVARSSRTASRDGYPPLQLLPDRRAPCH
jgi:hypothetical protein